MNPNPASSPRDVPDPPLEPALLERRLAARLIDIAILALPSFFALAIAAGGLVAWMLVYASSM